MPPRHPYLYSDASLSFQVHEVHGGTDLVLPFHLQTQTASQTGRQTVTQTGRQADTDRQTDKCSGQALLTKLAVPTSLHLVHGGYSSSVEQHTLCEGRLARVNVSRDTNVSNLLHIQLVNIRGGRGRGGGREEEGKRKGRGREEEMKRRRGKEEGKRKGGRIVCFWVM